MKAKLPSFAGGKAAGGEGTVITPKKGLDIIATVALLLNSSKDTLTAVYLGGWLVLLILSGLWLYSQRAYLD